jgi:uncharacterized protein YbjT (DUF2867 family)
MSSPILVTGAAGRVGSESVKALLSKGFSVRAASRSPEKIAKQPVVESIHLDYLNPVSVEQALSGVEAALLIAPPLDFEAPQKLSHFISFAAKKPGFHIVFISAFGVDQNEQAPLRVLEQMLFKSGVKYTILRPNFFMDNFTAGAAASSIKAEGIFRLSADDAKTAFIAASDIAAAVASAFADKLYNKEYNLTGPAALDHHEVAALISSACGKPVRYQSLPEDVLSKAMRDAGTPESIITYVNLLYGATRAGYMAAITDDVKRITGKFPISFADFAKKHISVWK